MPQTPDRRPGPVIEEESQYEMQAQDSEVLGSMRYVSPGNFRLYDRLGIYNPRFRDLRLLLYFIDDGPVEEFASGAYKEVTGTVFPTTIVWWESVAKLKKIVERLVTWGTSPKVATQDQWILYAADGSTPLVTVIDTISYAGPFETSRTRTMT